MWYDGNMGRTPGVESQSVVKYGLSYIRPYHREIARRLVLGQMQVDICEDLGMSVSRMSIIINSPLFKMELMKMEELRNSGVADVTKTLQEVSPLALEVIERTMVGGKSEAIRFKAAQDILDRAGHGVTTRRDVNVSGMVSHANLSEIELRKLVLERFKRMKNAETQKEQQQLEAESIEVKFEEVECSHREQPLEKFTPPAETIFNEPSWVD